MKVFRNVPVAKVSTDSPTAPRMLYSIEVQGTPLPHELLSNHRDSIRFRW